MNLKRFTARTSREALALVRQTFGEDAVVMSTRPCPEGVEVLAMAPESLQHLEKYNAPTVSATPATPAAPAAHAAHAARHAAARTDGPVEQDVEQLAMSTLSFQDYVRERMLKRRRSEMAGQGDAAPLAAPQPLPVSAMAAAAAPAAPRRLLPEPDIAAELADELQRPRSTPQRAHVPAQALAGFAPERGAAPITMPAAAPAENGEMLRELRSVRGLIEQRFGELAFIEKLQRQPRQALLSHRLLECGFSPVLVRKLVDGLPADGDEIEWASNVLQRNLLTGEAESPLEDVGGVFALIGPTGVGKTTSTAKLAAAFAARHGAGHLGLITLDAYRVAAHEQLRAYGRILGVPVHTAHDRASLDDLLELLAGKKMVLIDTAGMAQRDTRTKELLDMLSHRSVNRLLVVNAASQGETVEDVLGAYRANTCRGVILSKIDEAMKLAPALDALIRHKVKVLAVANGQRVPEDWHRLSAQALLQRALRAGGSSAWKLDNNDVSLVFTGHPAATAAALAHAA
ncbi:MAG: flagellar biosynthesis protein FlhF [Proteobacteria bacterium]|nr:flagellar biosynthesis protein FlhF [Pseudomonadota bacterium]